MHQGRFIHLSLSCIYCLSYDLCIQGGLQKSCSVIVNIVLTPKWCVLSLRVDLFKNIDVCLIQGASHTCCDSSCTRCSMDSCAPWNSPFSTDLTSTNDLDLVIHQIRVSNHGCYAFSVLNTTCTCSSLPVVMWYCMHSLHTWLVEMKVVCPFSKIQTFQVLLKATICQTLVIVETGSKVVSNYNITSANKT